MDRPAAGALMVLACKGTAAEVEQRLEAMAKEWRESKQPEVLKRRGLSLQAVARVGPRKYVVHAYEHRYFDFADGLYSIVVDVDLVEDAFGAVMKLEGRVSPAFIPTASVLMVLMAVLSFRVGDPTIVIVMSLVAAIGAYFGDVGASTRIDDTEQRAAMVLRFASNPPGTP